MKKQLFSILLVGAMGLGSLRAQSVSDGISHFYAERYKSAKAAFEKNAGNEEAVYWLGQTQLAMNDQAGAKATFSANPNSALSLVGLGQVELEQGKVNEARQHFEAAITMSKGRRGNNPVVLNAVGRAIAEVYNDKTKLGDINFAIQKLEEAVDEAGKDKNLLADIYLNLGNAYRRAKPGEAGGQAFTAYQNALVANPSFAVAPHRIAQLFFTQKNWSMYEKYLNDAVTADPKYAPAYYDLSYYKMGKLDFTASEQFAQKFSENSDPAPQNDYLRASILYAQKKYDQAIDLAKSIANKSGQNTTADVYKLLAYAYFDKNDITTARGYVDQYFAKQKPGKTIALDYKLKADIYSQVPGAENELVQIYKEGVVADTVVENKVKLLKEGGEFFEKKKMYVQQAAVLDELLKVKPNLSIKDYFDAGLANYRAAQYAQSRDIFTIVADKFPTEPFGWEWKFRNSLALDTVKKDSIAVPDAINLATFAEKDKEKNKTQYLLAVRYLAGYYVNDAKDFDKSLEYFQKWKDSDPENGATIQTYIDQINKAKSSQGSRPPDRSGGSK